MFQVLSFGLTNTGLFGSGATTISTFGQPQQSTTRPAFGSSGGFGQGTKPPIAFLSNGGIGAGLFGAKPATSAFGTGSFGSGTPGFGSSGSFGSTVGTTPQSGFGACSSY